MDFISPLHFALNSIRNRIFHAPKYAKNNSKKRNTKNTTIITKKLKTWKKTQKK